MCYMSADSSYLAITGDSLDEIVKLEFSQAYEVEKNWLATSGIVGKHLAYLSLKLLILDVCSLLQNALLFNIKIRPEKIKLLRCFKKA